jgi:hypothetical protein
MPKLSGNGIAEFMESMPGFWGAYKEMGRAMWAEGKIDPPLRELMRLKSAQLAGCAH